ncbi:hypothetical protein SCUCBS95973_009385 [Sporothrix curviconia]|uniref:Uncharacterized protein n=1 Tax=Sporothrix curviconia TaxID=1260050 RepID=A0ABP0CXA2_9PEZI
MCMPATCPTCSKQSWRGCGNHIPQALSQYKEEEWCTCTPRVEVNGKEYPPAAAMSIPGASFIAGLFGWGCKGKDKKEEL